MANPRPAARLAMRRAKQDQSTATSVLDARSQKAWKAVRHFTGMIPQFTSFARMATGNNRIVVRLGEGGAQTDGSAIFIAPPIALGEDRVHTRHLCDKRGENRRQLCKACDAMEVINFYLFHEIAHIAFDSMVPPMNYLVNRVEDMIDEWHPQGVCHHGSAKKQQVKYVKDYLNLAAIHNGFLPTIFNALEDARVNARMFQARPGLRVMFEAGIRKIFEDGIDRPDGTHFEWSSAPPNSQVIIGLFLLASGTGIEPGYFSDREAEVLTDPELIRLCNRVVLTRSAHQVMEVTLDAFARLDEMGYCGVPRCQPVPPMPSDPSAGQDDEENDANQGTDGTPSEPGDDDDSGSPSGSGNDESDEAESDGDDDDSGAGGSSGEDTGEAEGEPTGGRGEEPGSAEADDSDDTVEDGSRDGAGGSDDESDQQGDASADAPLRGTDDDHKAPKREDESEPSSPTGGAGARNDDDGDDSSDVEGAADPEDQGGTSEDDSSDPDDSVGDASGPSEPAQEGQDGDSGPGEEDDGHEADEDVQSTDDASGSTGDEGSPDEGARQKGDASVWDEPDDAVEPSGESEDGGDPEPYGDPADVEELVRIFGGHRKVTDDDVDTSGIDHHHFDDEDHGHEDGGIFLDELERETLDKQAIAGAIKQSRSFDTHSRYLTGLDVHTYPDVKIRWRNGYDSAPAEEFMPSESLMGGAVGKARLVFEDNRRAKEVRHLKSGRVDARVLGRRAPFGDPRLFAKRQRPGKKDYFAVIGLDCSGSTAWSTRNARIKRAAFAQAELFHRLGIPFAVYGMTGGNQNNLLSAGSYDDPEVVAMLEIKSPDEPWSKAIKERLANMMPIAENYDGHNMEFLRKVLDSRTETDRMIIYYTDGAMPAANADEELVVLQTELLTCKRKKYVVLAVGVNTDSPRQYGLDTVQVDSDEDLHLVVEQLGRKLTER